MTKQQLLDEAKALPPAERHELIEALRQYDDDGELTAEQRAELRRRLDDIKNGTAKFLDGDQALRSLLAEFARR